MPQRHETGRFQHPRDEMLCNLVLAGPLGRLRLSCSIILHMTTRRIPATETSVRPAIRFVAKRRCVISITRRQDEKLATLARVGFERTDVL